MSEHTSPVPLFLQLYRFLPIKPFIIECGEGLDLFIK